MNFYEAIQNRRSIYNINDEVVVSEEKVQEIITHALKHVPTAFNSQGNRVVVLFHNAHKKLWDTVKESLRKVVPTENSSPTEEKINSFKSGYGTVLYFEDTSVIDSLQKSYPLYADNFPIWSQQASGMLQFAIWSLLEVEGLGASLQHYNMFIEDFLKEEWHIQDNWRLVGQMPFGKQIGAPDDKQFHPLEDSLKVIQ